MEGEGGARPVPAPKMSATWLTAYTAMPSGWSVFFRHCSTSVAHAVVEAAAAAAAATTFDDDAGGGTAALWRWPREAAREARVEHSTWCEQTG